MSNMLMFLVVNILFIAWSGCATFHLKKSGDFRKKPEILQIDNMYAGCEVKKTAGSHIPVVSIYCSG